MEEKVWEVRDFLFLESILFLKKMRVLRTLLPLRLD